MKANFDKRLENRLKFDFKFVRNSPGVYVGHFESPTAIVFVLGRKLVASKKKKPFGHVYVPFKNCYLIAQSLTGLIMGEIKGDALIRKHSCSNVY